MAKSLENQLIDIEALLKAEPENQELIDKKAELTQKIAAKNDTTKEVDHKQEFKDHQEYCVLVIDYHNRTKDGQKKFKNKDRMNELKEICSKIKGKKAAIKKDLGIAKISVNASIVYITRDIPNPKLVVDKFDSSQQKFYFE